MVIRMVCRARAGDWDPSDWVRFGLVLLARRAEARRLHLFFEFGFQVADSFLEVGEAG